ncbi:hypothetical protein A2769_02705 [Candidatus Daviesbacteria bacterium RIFCSPHIGHO2_01_FULL_37_27]|nr:MAG: hypothetical protein A2769_02705 [Candidatus Daviesbacteria bacterium RIFCSPHIGHO2_01_FULL_37_27]OGE45634.1 MAG: hypothetical protein A3B39_00580 [Candidatus Daviesbacteria bacterium RIFCSPLOWO2_01_FULL_37_10]
MNILEDDSTLKIRGELEKVYQQDKKLSTLEKIVKAGIFINLFIGVLIITAVIFFVINKDKAGFIPQATEELKSIPERVVLASEEKPFPVFINEQSIDISKAFEADRGSIHVTSFGKLKRAVFGFLPYWVIPKLDEINIKLLTTVSYFGLEVDKNGNIIKNDSGGKATTPWFYFQSSVFDNFIKKAHSNKIKVVVTLKCFNQTNIVNLVTTQTARTNFVNNAIFLVDSKNLDGVNIDFEYIGEPEKEVREGFSLLIIELNEELKRQNKDAKLTVDTFVDGASNTRIHDVEVLSKHTDALVIMGYDFHTPQSSTAGPVAPMEGYGNSIVGLLGSYLEKVPPEKLILAVPYYGYDWPVSEAGKNASVSGERAAVKILPYAEIAGATKNTQIQWDENAKTPWYSYRDSTGLRVVHFENTRSLGLKYDFINQKNLSGVGIWALGFDGKREDLLQLLADKFTE